MLSNAAAASNKSLSVWRVGNETEDVNFLFHLIN